MMEENATNLDMKIKFDKLFTKLDKWINQPDSKMYYEKCFTENVLIQKNLLRKYGLADVLVLNLKMSYCGKEFEWNPAHLVGIKNFIERKLFMLQNLRGCVEKTLNRGGFNEYVDAVHRMFNLKQFSGIID